MKILIKFTSLIAILFFAQLSFANSILGSYTPTYQYFKITHPPSVTLYNVGPNSNFIMNGLSSCSHNCMIFSLATTPDSEQGGTMNISVSVNSNSTCIG